MFVAHAQYQQSSAGLGSVSDTVGESLYELRYGLLSFNSNQNDCRAHLKVSNLWIIAVSGHKLFKRFSPIRCTDSSRSLKRNSSKERFVHELDITKNDQLQCIAA